MGTIRCISYSMILFSDFWQDINAILYLVFRKCVFVEVLGFWLPFLRAQKVSKRCILWYWFFNTKSINPQWYCWKIYNNMHKNTFQKVYVYRGDKYFGIHFFLQKSAIKLLENPKNIRSVCVCWGQSSKSNNNQRAI